MTSRIKESLTEALRGQSLLNNFSWADRISREEINEYYESLVQLVAVATVIEFDPDFKLSRAVFDKARERARQGTLSLPFHTLLLFPTPMQWLSPEPPADDLSDLAVPHLVSPPALRWYTRARFSIRTHQHPKHRVSSSGAGPGSQQTDQADPR
jgi:hypothetical protein